MCFLWGFLCCFFVVVIFFVFFCLSILPQVFYGHIVMLDLRPISTPRLRNSFSKEGRKCFI